MPSLPEDPDAALMVRVREGDDAAFSSLMSKYRDAIFRLAYRYLGDAAEAEDAAQDVFVRVYLAAPRYRPKARFKTWLYRIAVNRCLDMKARRRLVPEAALARPGDPAPLDRAADRQPSPHAQVETSELARVVQEALARLPDRERAAVILSRYEEASLEEIAEALGSSVGAVKSLLHRAKARLREWLAPYVSEGSPR